MGRRDVFAKQGAHNTSSPCPACAILFRTISGSLQNPQVCPQSRRLQGHRAWGTLVSVCIKDCLLSRGQGAAVLCQLRPEADSIFSLFWIPIFLSISGSAASRSPQHSAGQAGAPCSECSLLVGALHNSATKQSFLVCVCWPCQGDDGLAWKGK